MKRSSHFHVNESDLLCKNRCGYYGNTLWKGYCSVCYKKLSGKQITGDQLQPIPTPSYVQKQSSQDIKQVTNFTRFEEKRKQLSERRPNSVGLKSLFGKKSPKATRKESSKVETSQLKVLGHTEGSSLPEFLSHLNTAIYNDISKRVQIFLNKFKSMPSNSTVELWSDTVQEFFLLINNHITSDGLYKNCDEKTLNTLMDHLEQYIMNRLYNAVFCPSCCHDEQEDLLLHKRIHSLHWVTIELLEANVNNDDLGVRSALDKSISDIIQLDTKKSPIEKLKCIVDCSKGIFEALKLTAESSSNNGGMASIASADDFLPVFIFIILKANPPRLKSNINYITRFACPTRLNSGEEGYFFTNMCCVVDFVEKLNADSLNITEDQFKRYMCGEAIPDGTNTVYMCEGLKLIHENQEMILKLKERQQQCMSSTSELEQRMTRFKKEFDDEISEMVKKAPLVIKPRVRKVDLDAELDFDPRLPVPLLPQQL